MSPQALVSAIVPTLNGGSTLPGLLAALKRAATRHALEIVAIDSGSRDDTIALLRSAGASVLDLEGSRFTHAGTRNRAAGRSRGDVLLFLTQDVEPVGETWLEPLLAAVRENGVGGAFGRQIPRGASPEETFLASANYPSESRTITRAALGAPFGPGATYFSNAFGVIRREVWERFPFPDVVMSEDQAWAQNVLGAGLEIRYVSDAAVYHGHALSLRRAFRRNFDSGSSLQALGLAGASWGAGLRHLIAEVRWIAGRHGAAAAGHAVLYEGVRMAGFQLGRRERWLPRALARYCGEAPRG
jgi:rhamnosyltransferase